MNKSSIIRDLIPTVYVEINIIASISERLNRQLSDDKHCASYTEHPQTLTGFLRILNHNELHEHNE